MSKIAFDAIGEMVVTLPVTEGVTGGVLVKLGEDGKAAPCGAGDRFCGVALGPKEGFAAVQVRGFVRVPCTDETVTTGWMSLTADGQGGVKAAGIKTPAGGDNAAVYDEAGEYLVAQVADGMVSLLL